MGVCGNLWWSSLLVAVMVAASSLGVKSQNMCDSQIEETLRVLLNPQDSNSVQIQALRRQLLRKLKQELDSNVLASDPDYKRSIASLAAWNNLPQNKRSLESLARAGYIKTIPNEEEEDTNYKRSINEEVSEQLKRGIEALARNGDLRRHKDLLEDLYDKRNVNLNYPNAFKRNIASLARDGKFTGKRDVNAQSGEKRNLQSIKAQQGKFKRQVNYYDDNGDYEMNYDDLYDYDDYLVKELAEAYPNAQKRFLGSVARSGWYRAPTTTARRYSTFVGPEKRHVGSLARLGWLPTYRNVRRFSRSGRSTNYSDAQPCRKTAADGKTEDNTVSEIPSVSLEDKRYLLQPAIDNILLRRQFMHPKSH